MSEALPGLRLSPQLTALSGVGCCWHKAESRREQRGQTRLEEGELGAEPGCTGESSETCRPVVTHPRGVRPGGNTGYSFSRWGCCAARGGPLCAFSSPSRRGESRKGEEVSPGGAETRTGTGTQRLRLCPECLRVATHIPCPAAHEGGTILPFITGGIWGVKPIATCPTLGS